MGDVAQLVELIASALSEHSQKNIKISALVNLLPT
jgi:hypothetical protein